MPKRQLTFLGLSEDGNGLVMADSAGSRFTIELDARLLTALGHPVRPGQMEIALQPLSPKDIQARIRAGATAEEISAETGEDLERVRRFEGPPLADRAFAAEQARRCVVRTATTDSTLDALVAARLDERGVTLDSAQWDAWRREDGRWTVLVAFPGGAAERVATWAYDPESRHVTPDDEEAERMVDPIEHESALRLVSSNASQPAQVVALDEKPSVDEPPVGEGSDESVEAVSVEVLAEVTSIAEVRSAPAPAAEPKTPTARPKSRSKRASVPSWDEILFGGGKDDEG